MVVAPVPWAAGEWVTGFLFSSHWARACGHSPASLRVQLQKLVLQGWRGKEGAGIRPGPTATPAAEPRCLLSLVVIGAPADSCHLPGPFADSPEQLHPVGAQLPPGLEAAWDPRSGPSNASHGVSGSGFSLDVGGSLMLGVTSHLTKSWKGYFGGTASVEIKWALGETPADSLPSILSGCGLAHWPT